MPGTLKAQGSCRSQGPLRTTEYQEEMALGRKRVLARDMAGPLHSFIPLSGRRRRSQWTNWNLFPVAPWLGSEDKKEPLFLQTSWRAAYLQFTIGVTGTHTHARAHKHTPPSEACTLRDPYTQSTETQILRYTPKRVVTAICRPKCAWLKSTTHRCKPAPPHQSPECAHRHPPSGGLGMKPQITQLQEAPAERRSGTRSEASTLGCVSLHSSLRSGANSTNSRSRVCRGKVLLKHERQRRLN